MDFGLARATGMSAPTSSGGATMEALTQSPTVAAPLTVEGSIVGTVQYMAPEQLEGRETDARSDLWALGCVLYEMATGRHAFEGTSPASLIATILKEQPRPLTEQAALMPAGFEDLVKKCLVKNPGERWQTASDLRRELTWIVTAWLAYAYGASGDRGRAMTELEDLRKKSLHRQVPPFSLALVYLGLGDHPRAMGYLEQAYATDSQWLGWLKLDHVFDPLRSEPRFVALLRKLGFKQ